MLRTYITMPDVSAIRNETLQGRKHLVVPIIALVECVFKAANSTVPEFIPAESISESVSKWNGRPVVIDHPRDSNNEFILANSPEVFNSEVIGTIFNSSFSDESKLKFEVWIDQERVKETKDPRISATVQALTTGKAVEISTGFIAMTLPVSGDFEGKSFEDVIFNIEPDHIAILSGSQKGACSWEMGCGAPRLNVNEDELGKFLTSNIIGEKSPEDVKKMYSFAQSFGVTVEEAKNVLTEEDKIPSKFKTILSNIGNTMLLKGKKDVKKKEIVAFLTSCTECKFDEKDTEWLMALEEEQLQKMVPKAAEEVEKTAEEIASEKAAADKVAADAASDVAKTVAAAAAAAKDNSPKSPTFEEILATAPKEMQEHLKRGLNMSAEFKNNLISSIKANAKNEFGEDELNLMPIESLERLAKLASPDDFSGAIGTVFNTGPKDEDLFPPEPERIFVNPKAN